MIIYFDRFSIVSKRFETLKPIQSKIVDFVDRIGLNPITKNGCITGLD